MQIAEDRTQGREETEQEDDDQADLLARVNLKLKEDGNGDDGDHDIRHDCDDGICCEGGARRKTRAGHQRIPRLVDLPCCTM